jgi:hypothetical protein
MSAGTTSEYLRDATVLQTQSRQATQVSLPTAAAIRRETGFGSLRLVYELLADLIPHFEGGLRNGRAEPCHYLFCGRLKRCDSRLEDAGTQATPTGMRCRDH